MLTGFRQVTDNNGDRRHVLVVGGAVVIDFNRSPPRAAAICRLSQKDISMIGGGCTGSAAAIVVHQVELAGIGRIDYRLRERIGPESPLQREVAIYPGRVEGFDRHWWAKG